MLFELQLKLINVDHQLVQLQWNKPQNIIEPLFELSMNENGQNWTIIYKGFHNHFYVKNLTGAHTYKFKLCMESNDKNTINNLQEVIMETISFTTKKDYLSVTAFHHGAYQNLPLLFREFLETRVKDINVYNELGECGLSRACAAGNIDIILTMLQHGANVNLPNMFTKTTPLMTAAYHGHCNIIRILAHNDADAAIKDINLKTALHYAVDGSQNSAVKMLLNEKWSDVNSVDSKGWTPLMRAVLLFSDLNVIKTLIENGSDVSLKDKNNQDVWQLAHLSNNWKALEILPN